MSVTPDMLDIEPAEAELPDAAITAIAMLLIDSFTTQSQAAHENAPQLCES